MKTPRLWLSQTVPFRDRKHVAVYGLSLAGHGSSTIVVSMDVGGPAAKAGIKMGDIVTKINGMDAVRVLPHLASLMQDPLLGERIHLTVERAKKPIEVTVPTETIP